MKTIVFTFSLFLIGLVFSSCEVENHNSIIGKWELREKIINNKQVYLDDCDYYNGFRFKSNNQVNVYYGEFDFFDDCSINYDHELWHYSDLDNSYIYITNNNTETEYYYHIYGNQLTLESFTNNGHKKIIYVLERVY